MENDNKFIVGIVNGKEWILQCDQLPGSLRKRVSNQGFRKLNP